MAAVEVEGLWEGYRPKSAWGWRKRTTQWALRDISFEVEPGEVMAVLGGNGSGKTTLLQTLSGVLRPTRGAVRTYGRVSSLVDATGFASELTGNENILIGAQLLGVQRKHCAELRPDIAAFSQLPPEVLAAPLRTYSAGMVLRLGLSLVLNIRPDVLLLDEVLAVGDESFQTRSWARVRELCHDGCAVVVVTHRLEQVELYCDRAIVLQQGDVVFSGDAKAGLAYYRSSEGAASGPPRWAHLLEGGLGSSPVRAQRRGRRR